MDSNFEYDLSKLSEKYKDLPAAVNTSSDGAGADFFSNEAPTLAEVTPSFFDIPKYRSIAALPYSDPYRNLSTFVEPAKEGYIPGPPKLQKSAEFDVKPPVLKESFVSSGASLTSPSTSSSKFIAPEKPFLVMSTNFETSQPLNRIVALVEDAFSTFAEVSFELVPHDGLWNAVYLRGSTHCKFQVHVYFSHENVHVIEANRLQGDASSFRNVFAEIKSVFGAAIEEMPKGFDMAAMAQPLPDSELLSDIEAREALKPIIEMAKCGFMEAQLEACRVMCDLSVHDGMQQHMCDNGCIQVLVDLASSPCEWTRQHAFLTLANLSEAQSCQEAIIDAGILPVLLKQAKDGPYNLAEMSRESARILANLSSRMASRVIAVLGHHAVTNWINSVEDLNDERLRLHASRAKESLSVVFAT